MQHPRRTHHRLLESSVEFPWAYWSNLIFQSTKIASRTWTSFGSRKKTRTGQRYNKAPSCMNNSAPDFTRSVRMIVSTCCLSGVRYSKSQPEKRAGLGSPQCRRSSQIAPSITWQASCKFKSSRKQPMRWVIPAWSSKIAFTWDRNDPKSGLASPNHEANMSGLILGCMKLNLANQYSFMLLISFSIFQDLQHISEKEGKHMRTFASLQARNLQHFATYNLSCTISVKISWFLHHFWWLLSLLAKIGYFSPIFSHNFIGIIAGNSCGKF